MEEARLEAAFEAAMEQIKKKDYAAFLHRYGVSEIWIYIRHRVLRQAMPGRG